MLQNKITNCVNQIIVITEYFNDNNNLSSLGFSLNAAINKIISNSPYWMFAINALTMC